MVFQKNSLISYSFSNTIVNKIPLLLRNDDIEVAGDGKKDVDPAFPSPLGFSPVGPAFFVLGMLLVLSGRPDGREAEGSLEGGRIPEGRLDILYFLRTNNKQILLRSLKL